MAAITKQLIGPDQMATLTGKSFTLKPVAGSKDFILTPIVTKGSTGVTNPILLTNPAVEGLPVGAAAKTGAGAKTMAVGKGAKVNMAVAKAKGVLPQLVEIEGAGKVLGAGKGATIGGLEIVGTMQTGQAGNTILLQGGEATVTQAAIKTKAAGVIAKGAKAGTVVTTPSATAMATKGVAKTGGTIWSGGGWSLGLGLGLGAWGPVLLLGTLTVAGIGVYKYLQNQNQKLKK